MARCIRLNLTKWIALVLAFSASQGCSYLSNRVSDAGDMADLGVTLSATPQLAVYACGFGLVGAGYGHIKGAALGLFGGRFGFQKMETKVWAAGPIGRNDVQVGDQAMKKQCTGAICVLQRTPEGMEESYSCCHYLHLGFVGVAANLHYKEIGDFFCGLVGYDLSGDDSWVRKRAVLVEKEKPEELVPPQWTNPFETSTEEAPRFSALDGGQSGAL